MPRQKNGPNKSAAVRELLNKNPKMPVKEIISTLGTKGMTLKPSLVYFIKSQTKRRRRKAMRKSMASAGIADPVGLIMKVRGLAHEVGGIKKLQALVTALAE